MRVRGSRGGGSLTYLRRVAEAVRTRAKRPAVERRLKREMAQKKPLTAIDSARRRAHRMVLCRGRCRGWLIEVDVKCERGFGGVGWEEF